MVTRPSQTSLALNDLRSELRGQARLLGGLVGLLWVIHIVNAVLFGGHLSALGIHPRSLHGLVGIVFAPFLHANFAHLIANTVPMLLLGGIVMQRSRATLVKVSALSALVGGLGTWLIAPAASVHVGASILIFGYLGYLLLRGYFERHWLSMLGSAAVFVLFGGALWGVLPGQEGISWQGHLFGLLGGILAAKWLHQAPAAASAPARRVATASRVERLRAGSVLDAPLADEPIEEQLERLRRMSR